MTISSFEWTPSRYPPFTVSEPLPLIVRLSSLNIAESGASEFSSVHAERLSVTEFLLFSASVMNVLSQSRILTGAEVLQIISALSSTSWTFALGAFTMS